MAKNRRWAEIIQVYTKTNFAIAKFSTWFPWSNKIDTPEKLKQQLNHGPGWGGEERDKIMTEETVDEMPEIRVLTQE